MSQDLAIEEKDKSKKEGETEEETGLATEGTFNIEKIFKKYIIPSLDDLWSKFTINGKEALGITETVYYTLQGWWNRATNSYIYIIGSNSVYYLGGWAFKKFFYDPGKYFFSHFLTSFMPKLIKAGFVETYTEIVEILIFIRKWVMYPALEGVIFLDKTMGSIFYIFALPVVFFYKNLTLSYYITQNGIEKVRYWLYNYFYSTKLPENPYDEEEEEEESEIDNKPNLGWKIAETAIPTALIVGVVVWGFRKIFRKK